MHEEKQRPVPMSRGRFPSLVNMDGLWVGVVELTPELAEEIQASMNNFRDRSGTRVDRLAESITNGEFEFNGETIKFNKDGFGVDGQHRVAAVIKANRPVKTLVVWGIASDINIDTGVQRKLRDLLKSRGEQYPKTLSAALGWLWKWERDRLRSTGRGAMASVNELLNELDKFPDIRQSISRTFGMQELMPASALAFLHCAFSRHDSSGAAVFFHALETGANLSEDDPIFHLRKILLTNNANKRHKMPLILLIGYTIKAYNMWRQGVPVVRNLKLTLVGRMAEAFPKIPRAGEEEAGETQAAESVAA